MKLTKWNSDQEVYVNTSEYKINWDRKVSGPQKLFKDFIKPFWENDYVLEEVYIPGSKKRIDIWNETKAILVEISPKHHRQYNEFFHKSRSGFLKILKTDLKKQSWAVKNGYEMITLNDDDIKNLSAVLFREKFGVNL